MVAVEERKEKADADLSAEAVDLVGDPLVSLDQLRAIFKELNWRNMRLGDFGAHFKVFLIKVPSMWGDAARMLAQWPITSFLSACDDASAG